MNSEIIFYTGIPLAALLIIFFLNYIEKNKKYNEFKKEKIKELIYSMKKAAVNKVLSTHSNIIITFLIRYISNWKTWPTKIEIPDDEISIFNMLLEDKGIIIPENILRNSIFNMYEILRQIKFNESFNKYIKTHFSFDVTVNKYIEIFEYNDEYLELFSTYLKNNGYIFSPDELEYKISECIKQHELRMKKINLEEKIKYNIHNTFSINDIDIMTGHEFERFLKILFTRLGYRVELTKQTGDQGADLILNKFNIKYAVQAKRYLSSVGNSAIQEVVSAMKYYQCDKGLVITNSYFTRSAIELALKCNIELWDRNTLVSNIKKI